MPLLLTALALLAACSSSRAPAPRATDAAPATVTATVTDAATVTVTVTVTDAAPASASALVDVTTVIPDAVLDMRYATDRNFTGAQIYPVARCLLRRAVADRLADAATALRARGYRLLLWDCYRPASVQQLLWDRVQDPRYVAEPRFDRRGRPVSGSVHSRGAAIDVSLADSAGAPLPMPTDHDFFGPAAHRDHHIADRAIRDRAAALDRAMTDAGFEGLPTEWWHYGAHGSSKYPLLDEAF